MKKIVLFCLAITLLISSGAMAADLLTQLPGTVEMEPGYQWIVGTDTSFDSTLIGQQVQVNGVNYTVVSCFNPNLLAISVAYQGPSISGKPIYLVVPPINTTNNNFTFANWYNYISDGSNDVTFQWDQTLKTAVAASGQVPNATISSSCPFWNYPWSTHDVAIYGPGTYTVYAGCPAGSPGCGTGTPITFTVLEGELGLHLLWDGYVNEKNIDVVNVFAPSSTASTFSGCGSNPADKVWDWVSTDFDGDGIPGMKIVDGLFAGTYFNFNLMGVPGVNNACALPWGGSITDGSSVTAWQSSSLICGSCTSETRTCNNGVLSGSYQYQSCTTPGPCASCTFNGQTVASGESVLAYQASTPPCGSTTCTSQYRTCYNGVLNGTYQYPSCTKTYCSCTWADGGSAANGWSGQGYYTPSNCSAPTNACCNDGSWLAACNPLLKITVPFYKSCYSTWKDTSGSRNYGETCTAWLTRTGQLGTQRRAISNATQLNYCVYSWVAGTTNYYGTMAETTTNASYKPVASGVVNGVTFKTQSYR